MKSIFLTVSLFLFLVASSAKGDTVNFTGSVAWVKETETVGSIMVRLGADQGNFFYGRPSRAYIKVDYCKVAQPGCEVIVLGSDIKKGAIVNVSGNRRQDFYIQFATSIKLDLTIWDSLPNSPNAYEVEGVSQPLGGGWQWLLLKGGLKVHICLDYSQNGRCPTVSGNITKPGTLVYFDAQPLDENTYWKTESVREIYYPIIEANPSFLDFGGVPSGSIRTMSLSITNRGTGPTQSLSFRIPSPIFRMIGTDCPSIFPPGANCQVQVSMEPPLGFMGKFEAELQISMSPNIVGIPVPKAIPLRGDSISIIREVK